MNLLRLLFWTLPAFAWNGLRLMLFVVALAPGFICFAWYYFVSADRVSLSYGQDSIRQTLDVYRSSRRIEANNPTGSSADTTNPNFSPVLVFYSGGGWMIGYKMWGALLARALVRSGIVVVMPDLRNYPLGTVESMIQDVDLSLQWTFDHIAEYGGDQQKVVVVGQSAGGHVSFMAVLEKLRILRQSSNPNNSNSGDGTVSSKNEDTNDVSQHDICENDLGHPSPYSLLPQQDSTIATAWMPSDLKGLVSISSPFSLQAMSNTFQKKGLDDKLVERIFGHQTSRYDPFVALEEYREQPALLQKLPPVVIYHGTADATVPYESAERFFKKYRALLFGSEKSKVSFVSYPDWSHTDPILEGPMDADQRLHQDLFRDVQRWTATTTTTDKSILSWPADDPVIVNRLCPHFMVQLGRWVNPF